MSLEMTLDIENICRVCLRGELDMKLIFEPAEIPTIAQMLTELTIYKVERFDGLPDSICLDCFSVVLSAYHLKQQCEQSYRTLIGLININKTNSNAICSPPKDLLEKCTQTDESSMYPCERCEEKFFTYDALRLHRQTEHKGSAIVCRFCSRTFDRIGYLKTHLAVFHPDSGYRSHNQCHICKRQFTRREHFRRHIKVVHKVNNDDLETSREELELIPEDKSNKNTEEKTNTAGEDIEESGSEKELHLWHDDHLGSLTDDEEEKPAPTQTTEVHEFEEPLADLLNNTPVQTREDVFNESLMEDNVILDDGNPNVSTTLNPTTKIMDGILQPPKRSRGRPPKKPPNCKYCDKAFNDPSMIHQHILDEHIQAQHFPCKICKDHFLTHNELEIHLTTNHTEEGKQLIYCDQCDKSFNYISQYKRHKETHTSHTNKLYPCSICEKSFCTKNFLQRHLDNHDKKRYVCKECSQDFSTREELNNHAKVEGHDKPLLCPECGLRCKTSNILTVHMRRHNGEKPFKCKFCSKGFPRMDDLRIHEKYHTGEKSHFCEICGKGFLRKYNLRIHLRVHTGEKPYKCPHCPQAFAQGNDLKAHIRRHTGERFRCELCGAAFLQAYQIRQHKLQEHGIREIPPTQRVEKFTSLEEQEQQIKQNLQRELVKTLDPAESKQECS